MHHDGALALAAEPHFEGRAQLDRPAALPPERPAQVLWIALQLARLDARCLNLRAVLPHQAEEQQLAGLRQPFDAPRRPRRKGRADLLGKLRRERGHKEQCDHFPPRASASRYWAPLRNLASLPGGSSYQYCWLSLVPFG